MIVVVVESRQEGVPDIVVGPFDGPTAEREALDWMNDYRGRRGNSIVGPPRCWIRTLTVPGNF